MKFIIPFILILASSCLENSYKLSSGGIGGNNPTSSSLRLTQLGAITSAHLGDNSAYDECTGVSVDSAGNVYCAGHTTGAFGEANGGGVNRDAFIMKLNSSGVIQWVTQLGATTTAHLGNNSGFDSCFGVSVDSAGNVYCAGYTDGAIGEANGGGGGDAFIMKLNSSGAVQWVTQLGATTTAHLGDNSGFDICTGVSVDSAGNVYCAGYTNGALGEANGGAGGGLGSDAFIMKLDSSGALLWLTQLGAITAPGGDNGNDYCLGVSVDSLGNAFCAGYAGTLGEANGGNVDAFIMKLNSSGARQWVTQLGATTTAPGGNNSGGDYCLGVSVDSAGNVYCAGYTDGALGEANGGGEDAFIMKLNSSGVL